MADNKSQSTEIERHRRPGDLVFAIVVLMVSVFLLSQLGEQTKWVKRTQLFSQPAFWPAASLIGMVFFGILHAIGSWRMPKSGHRMLELVHWSKSLVIVFWFMIYVLAVPYAGYLLSTIAFTLLLAVHMGYRDKKGFVQILSVCENTRRDDL